MSRKNKPAASASPRQSLRERAETQFAKKAALTPEHLEALSPEATRQILYELHVHQIELEMQNEELRESHLALDLVRARYFDLYDLAPVGYCTINGKGLIMQANLTAASLLCMTRSQLVKRPFSRFIHKQDQDLYYLNSKQLLENGESQSCELRMLKNDGTPFWVHLAVNTAQDPHGVPQLLAVLTNITERKRIEAERTLLDLRLQEKNVELEHAKLVAEKASRAKSDFLSSMSHELRTPLNAILGFAQLLASDTQQPTPKQQQCTEQILKAGWYLLDLINEILDLALVESGTLSMSLEPVLLTDVMNECEAMIELEAQKRDIRVTFGRLQVPYLVNADQKRLKQVLINLLSNAIKYNKLGGTVAVDCSVNTPGRLRICIKDTGTGLSQEQITHLFQPFNRLGQEYGAEQGTGIGLVITRRLIELMGGEIGLESTVGVGSSFWIELNLTDKAQPYPQLDRTQDSRSGA
jgi:PAS domain S-box-containing protein